jgi:O-antigen/teichoic acid export membrane protein
VPADLPAQAAEEPGVPRSSSFVWGLTDQALSSATTLLFTLIAARSLGPSGLGTVTLGFAAYLSVLGVHRSLVIDPLLTRLESSTRTPREALRGAISITASGALILALLGVALGLTTSGVLALGILAFAPWIAPALIHALIRAWLYREGRGRIATISSAAWLLAMLAAAGAGLHADERQMAAAWGIGACAALAVVAANTAGVGLTAPRPAVAWFLGEALRAGIWRSASGIIFSVAIYVRVAVMSSILGPAAVGGYRAIETAFAPTSLIGPALGNPGLPMMRKLVERRSPHSWALALKISALSAGLAIVYIVPVVLGRNLVITIFGSGFRGYESLILPIAVGAIVGALGTGFTLLLIAARKMKETALIVLLNAGLTLGLALPLAALSGLEAAAWGVAIAAAPPLLVIIVIARRVVGGWAEPVLRLGTVAPASGGHTGG